MRAYGANNRDLHAREVERSLLRDVDHHSCSFESSIVAPSLMSSNTPLLLKTRITWTDRQRHNYGRLYSVYLFSSVCTCVLGNLTRHSSLCTSRGKISAFRSVLQTNRSASTMSHNRRYFCYCLGKNKGKRKRADKLCACVFWNYTLFPLPDRMENRIRLQLSDMATMRACSITNNNSVFR